MFQLRRIGVSFTVVASLLALTISPVAAVDPTEEVRLADGTLLPPAPDGALQPSIHAQMQAEHESVEMSLSEGSTPTTKLSSPTATSGSEGSITSASDDEGSALGEETGSAAYTGPAGALPNGLRREVLGFLPYWMLDSRLSSLRYDRVSTIAYFGIPVQKDGYLYRGPSSNPYIGWTAWKSSAMTDVINKAHARGVRVVPTITMMAWNGDYTPMSTLLNTSSYRTRLVNEVVGMIRDRNADGVNVDFEPVPSSLRSQFTSFVRQLKQGLVNAGVRNYVTVDTMAGAATWSTGYDVAGLSASGAADALMVMAYDFSWSGSARAGGVAPISSPYILDASSALADHLEIVHPSKIIWGIPYYGRTWPTQTDKLNSLTCRATSPPTCPDSKVTAPGASAAYTYTGAKSHAATYGRRWDATGQVPWYAWYDSANTTWRQGYYDDPQSLRAKYDMVIRNNVAGIGIWALLMDAGTNDLNNVILDRFVKIDTRIAGGDRFATAAKISAAHFQPGVPVAFVATGDQFPDALAGGAAAAKAGGPILLVQRDSVPSVTATELSRLKPARIVVLGGTGAVSDTVRSALGAYTSGGVTRIGGADRFVTAAAISGTYFGAGVPVVYVATGSDFPDALGGGAAAARGGGPVLLVKHGGIPAATANELGRLKPGKIVVLGGSGVISGAVESALGAYAPQVVRLAGADRYGTAVAISKSGFAADAPSTVFVAAGASFPDGLSAAVAAKLRGAPLLLVPADRLPGEVAAELLRLNPSTVVVLGGTGVVSSTVVASIRALWP